MLDSPSSLHYISATTRLLCSLTPTVAVQLAAKQAAKDGADSDSDDGGIIEVDEDMMRQREFAAAVAAAAAAPLPEVLFLQCPQLPPALSTSHDCRI